MIELSAETIKDSHIAELYDNSLIDAETRRNALRDTMSPGDERAIWAARGQCADAWNRREAAAYYVATGIATAAEMGLTPGVTVDTLTEQQIDELLPTLSEFDYRLCIPATHDQPTPVSAVRVARERCVAIINARAVLAAETLHKTLTPETLTDHQIRAYFATLPHGHHAGTWCADALQPNSASHYAKRRRARRNIVRLILEHEPELAEATHRLADGNREAQLERRGGPCDHPRCLSHGKGCRMYTAAVLTPTDLDLIVAKRLHAEGWIQVSARYRTVRRWTPPGPPSALTMIAPEFRGTAWGRRALRAIERDVLSDNALHAEHAGYDATISDEHAGARPLNPLIEERVLTPGEFKAFKKTGGTAP